MAFSQYQSYHERKNHTDPVFPFNVFLCSIPLDFASVPTHWHEEAELIVVKKGCGIVHIDFTPYAVEAGCIVLVLPGQLHSIEQESGAAMEYENLLFHLTLLEGGSVDACKSLFFEPLLSGALQLPAVLRPALSYHRAALECVQELDAICADKAFGWQLGVRSSLLQLFYVLMHRAAQAQPVAPRPKSYEKLKEILKYIEQNYAMPLTVQKMAAAAGFSASHFMKFFKANTGVPFTEYLNDYRLNAAAQLLLSQPMDVSEIAAAVGYENLSYFNRLFKRKYAVSPTFYRNHAAQLAP